MVFGNQKRTRSERVAALELPPGMVERTVEYLQHSDVLTRLGLCFATVLSLWAITGSWEPPFPFRTGYTPPRNIVARVPFEVDDPQATHEAEQKIEETVRSVYEVDKEPLVNLRARLKNTIANLIATENLRELDKRVWDDFFAPPRPDETPLTPEEKEQHFKLFRTAIPNQEELDDFDRKLTEVLATYEKHGMLDKLGHTQGNQREILVHPRIQTNEALAEAKRTGLPVGDVVQVSDVLVGDGEALRQRLYRRFPAEVAARTFDWLRPLLPSDKMLTYNKDETTLVKDKARASVGRITSKYKVGDKLAQGSVPLNAESIKLLRVEYAEYLNQLSVSRRVYFSLASLGMFIALSILCGVYVLCYERKLLESLRHFATMCGLLVATVGLSMLGARDDWRAELIPILLFGMTVAVAYHQELALLFSAAVSLVVVMAIGQGLSEFIIMTAGAATAILLVGRIRSRTKLLYVGLCIGVVVFFTTVGVGVLDEQPIREATGHDAIRFAIASVLAGVIMLALLPSVENVFQVQTDLSLLELGDIAHPLLQELVRRAPGTYNHSINVASIAEAAAESIGARGLLVRVGAYFHDIGKMLKPGYFVENQGTESNRHDSLNPAMSTLIIIAHIKDGADLARQHHLPQPIIDFIQQHHGTTLVEYFFRRASQQNEKNPDGGEVEESAFRYPGPKPQTKETAVLMLADAVESASRALVEPTPSRIENLVHEIAMKRLLDGQFDQCGLTLQQLATVEDSLAKSLTAVYHGRVKYPEQRTA